MLNEYEGAWQTEVSSFFFFFLLSLVGISAKYLYKFLSSNYPFTFLKISYKGFALLIFNIFQIFDCHIFNVGYKNISLWLFISFNIFWIKTFYTDNNVKKVVCVVSNAYTFHFIIHFWFILLIHKFF